MPPSVNIFVFFFVKDDLKKARVLFLGNGFVICKVFDRKDEIFAGMPL